MRCEKKGPSIKLQKTCLRRRVRGSPFPTSVRGPGTSGADEMCSWRGRQWEKGSRKYALQTGEGEEIVGGVKKTRREYKVVIRIVMASL